MLTICRNHLNIEVTHQLAVAGTSAADWQEGRKEGGFCPEYNIMQYLIIIVIIVIIILCTYILMCCSSASDIQVTSYNFLAWEALGLPRIS
jgi:uncharacterized membrane protein